LSGWMRHCSDDMLATNPPTHPWLGKSDERKELGSVLAVVTQP
jgi:hypothetical protein